MIFFLTFAQNINCGYALEPVNPHFTIIIKVGCKGVFITRTCWHDVTYYICSAQSKNRYDSGIVPAQSRNPTLSADSGIVPDNSRIAQGIYIVSSSNIICAQSRNRVGQSKNLMGSAK